MKWIKFWILGIVVAVVIIIRWEGSVNLPGFAATPDYLAQEAANLTQQGNQYFAIGNSEFALQKWQAAEEIYERISNSEGVMGSRINQGLALQGMGQSRRACQTLVIALSVEEIDNQFANICDATTDLQIDFDRFIPSKLNAIGLRHLGNVLRSLDQIQLAQQALGRSLAIAGILNSSIDLNAAFLGLGNLEESVYEKMRELFERTNLSSYRNQAIYSAKKSLNFYQQVENAEGIRAQLNRLKLLLEVVDWLTQEDQNNPSQFLTNQRQSLQAEILPLAQQLSSTSFENFTPIDQIYAQLNLAYSLIQLQPINHFFESALKAAVEAHQLAQNLNKNYRLQSETFGAVGYLYERNLDYAEAHNYTQSAITLAQSIQAPDLVYKWSWQLGRIDQAVGETKSAIEDYTIAVNSLDIVRKDILKIDSDLQLSFRNKVKPLYEEFINLLLQSPQPSQENITQAITVSNQFQAAELENFLKCNLSASNEEQNPQISTLTHSTQIPIDSHLSIIRIIVLEKFNRAIEIVQSNAFNSELHCHEISPENWKLLKGKINYLNKKINSDHFQSESQVAVESTSRLIYKILISPLQIYLPKTGTLVFILDSELQNIPMSILQNDQGNFLVQDYAIALNLPENLSKNSQISPRTSKVLAAGLSIKGTSFNLLSSRFSALENVEDEILAIQESTDSSSILLDQEFTVKKFEQRIQQLDFPIIHIATHGQFSSIPEETFLLAYDQIITINDLDNMLRKRNEGTDQQIDLLVLSACQTAKDDKRGTLGLAGVAIRAGADSTVASLWNISDRATAYFMKEFYLALKQPNLSKAEALRQAQLKFITDSAYTELGYNHPYYWAAFVLVGDSE